MRKYISLLWVLLLCASSGWTQENLNYQKPPQEILDLVDIELAPSVMMDDEKNYLIFRYRNPYKTIEELSQEELRLGGLRIDPNKYIGSRTTYTNNVRIQQLKGKNQEVIQVKGLPNNPKLSNFSWSPDQTKVAMTHTGENGVEIWVLDLATAQANMLMKGGANANLGDVINWFEDSNYILVKRIAANNKGLIDKQNSIPAGPTISVNEGKRAQNRTYQDLLKDPIDEHNFEQLAVSELFKVSLDGKAELWMDAGMYDNISFSPDGEYVMITTVEKPFSYLVPYRRFPSRSVVYTKSGDKVKEILNLPLIEDLPKGFMAVRTGMRNISWRADQPSTLVYVEALDGGDPAKKVEFRDEVFVWEAPFNGKSKSILKTRNRYSGIVWGNTTTAVAYDSWFDNRNTKTYLFNPSNPNQKPVIISDRNSQDRYSDPGDFVTTRNAMGSYVLAMNSNSAYLIGDGFSEKGQFPFVDKIDIRSGKSSRVYESSYTDRLESIMDYDVEGNKLLVRIESSKDYPNYFFRSMKGKKSLTQITSFENPFKSLQDIHKEVITYKREDGLELSGTLYLPAGYDREKKEKLPMILWAYPREYKDKSSASQTTANPNRFTYPSWGSPVYWVTRGYAVLDGAAFPIIGEGDKEPNDSFREQLVANGKAAIDAVDKLGYIDRNRVAVGGHSYGAFMVANLLSHSNLFAAGIARSGAYNRTLTPFGFQREQRSYWDAPEVYYTMSPFMHADKMKTPLLLVHGEADNNSGTYPMQSIRYFNALKGLGATARLVMFPKESHGYRAKETILHLLWEQDQWLDKYVKNKNTPMEGTIINK